MSRASPGKEKDCTAGTVQSEVFLFTKNKEKFNNIVIIARCLKKVNKRSVILCRRYLRLMNWRNGGEFLSA